MKLARDSRLSTPPVASALGTVNTTLKAVRGLNAVLGLLATGAVGAETLDNPQPNKNIDIVLPMPCDRTMTFVEVEVTGSRDGALGDALVALGTNLSDVGYSEGPRESYLAGAFPKDVTATRTYWIGRYEVNGAQWGAVLDECKESRKPGHPVVGETFIDAQAFAHQYSLWLHKNHASKLPKVDDSPPFLRLPTEAEWEYAARGGGVVSPSEFRADRFPMPEGVEQYVWFNDPQLSRGKLQEIGALEPNPLGLHDVLGNAAEYVLDSYQLNKHGRLHGQVGGWLVKGGHVRVAKKHVRTTWRQEVSPYTKAGRRTLKRVGLRLVLSLPVERTAARLSTIREEWRQLPKIAPQPAAPKTGGEKAKAKAKAKADPIEELHDLAASAPDPAFKKRLEGLVSVLRANVRTRNDARDRAASSQLRMVSLMAHRAHRHVCLLGRLQSIAAQYADNAARAAKFTKRAEREAEQADSAIRHYLDGVVEYADGFPVGVIEEQAPVTQHRMTRSGLQEMALFVSTATAHVQSVKGGRLPEPTDVVDALIDIPRDGKRCIKPK